MMPDTLTSPEFIPQTVIPPEKPLPLIRGLLQTIANPLHVWPRAMYENPYHGVKWIGRTFHYFRKPEHMKAVFLDHADIFRKSQFQKKLVGPALGDGLLTSEGDHWKFQRRAASPAFRIDALRALVPAFSTSAEATIERIRKMPAGQAIDMQSEMQHATLDVIVETILGGADPNFGYSRIAGTVEDYMLVMGKPDVLDLFGTPNWVPRPWGGKGRRAAAALRAAATNAIARRRASGETRVACGGRCPRGYFCPWGSANATARPCGSPAGWVWRPWCRRLAIWASPLRCSRCPAWPSARAR
jgi:cytochrome P450